MDEILTLFRMHKSYWKFVCNLSKISWSRAFLETYLGRSKLSVMVTWFKSLTQYEYMHTYPVWKKNSIKGGTTAPLCFNKRKRVRLPGAYILCLVLKKITSTLIRWLCQLEDRQAYGSYCRVRMHVCVSIVGSTYAISTYMHVYLYEHLRLWENLV